MRLSEFFQASMYGFLQQNITIPKIPINIYKPSTDQISIRSEKLSQEYKIKPNGSLELVPITLEQQELIKKIDYLIVSNNIECNYRDIEHDNKLYMELIVYKKDQGMLLKLITS